MRSATSPESHDQPVPEHQTLQDDPFDTILARYGLPPVCSPRYQRPEVDSSPRTVAYHDLMVKLGIWDRIPSGPIPTCPILPVDLEQWPPPAPARDDEVSGPS